jgi:hypothetical protein
VLRLQENVSRIRNVFPWHDHRHAI